MEPKIMLVEDKALTAEDVLDKLEHFGYKDIMGPYSSADEALNHAKINPPDIAVLDINLKGKKTGIDLARELNRDRTTPIVYLSKLDDEKTFQEAIQTYPVAFVSKPFSMMELRVSIHNAVKAAKERINADIETSKTFQVLDDRVFLRNGRGKYYLMLDQVLWIQSNGGETSTIMTEDKLDADPKLLPVVGHNLSKLEERLSFYPHLIRVSRYYICNTLAVERLLDASKGSTRKKLLIRGHEIPVGDKYRKSVMDRFHII